MSIASGRMNCIVKEKKVEMHGLKKWQICFVQPGTR